MLSRAMGLVAAGVLMLGSLAACGSDDGDDAAAEPSTPETTTSPSPTVPPQPDGPHGVTLKINNWDEYYDDPAVLTVKDFLEGFGGAYTAKKITPELKSSTSKKVLRELTGPLKSIWRDERLPADTLELRILSVKSNNGKATVKACAHEITFIQRYKDGSLTEDVDKDYWRKHTYKLRESDGEWKLSKNPDLKGSKCKATPGGQR